MTSGKRRLGAIHKATRSFGGAYLGSAIVFGLGGILLLTLLAIAPQHEAVGAPEGKVDICHSTASQSNPYVANQPDKSGDVNGHDGHNGPIWFPGITVEWGDIIPPFEYTDQTGTHMYPGKNWTAEGQAIWENGCTIPGTNTPTPTPTNTPVNTNTPTNTPTNTSVPGTSTPTNTPTNTSVPGTSTPTNTPTNTSVPGTNTPTNTPTNTSVPGTSTPTNTPTNTSVPGTSTPTNTPVTGGSTSLETPTATSTGEAAATSTPTTIALSEVTSTPVVETAVLAAEVTSTAEAVSPEVTIIESAMPPLTAEVAGVQATPIVSQPAATLSVINPPATGDGGLIRP
jgi:hypothetical protein